MLSIVACGASPQNPLGDNDVGPSQPRSPLVACPRRSAVGDDGERPSGFERGLRVRGHASMLRHQQLPPPPNTDCRRQARWDIRTARGEHERTGSGLHGRPGGCHSFCMDWPVQTESAVDSFLQGNGFRAGQSGLSGLRHATAGGQQSSADEALNRIGWTRCGAWHRDSFGRLAARVIAVGAAAATETARRLDGPSRARIGSSGRRSRPSSGLRGAFSATLIRWPPLIRACRRPSA